MDPNIWSLIHVPSGVEKPFSSWGIAADCQRQLQNAATDSFTFHLPGLHIDAALPFAVTDSLIIKRNGVRYFYGRVTKSSVSGSPGGESVSFVLEGPWWWLDHRVYQQEWIVSTNYTLTGTVFVSELRPRVVLFQDLVITYVLGNISTVNGLAISVGAQIRKILEYAIGLGAPMQIGTIDPPTVLPNFSEIRDATCGELIRTCLRWVPDCVAWFDYSTDPPTIHVRSRSALVSVSVPMILDPTESLTVTPRHDIKIAGVKMLYEQTNSVNDMSWAVTTVDSAGSPDDLQGIICSVQLSGSSVTVQYQWLSIAQIDLTSQAFWESALPWLKQATDVTIENVRVNNELVTGQTADPTDALAKYDKLGVKDITNELQTFAPAPSALQNLLASGQVPHWLKDDFKEVTVTAKLSYTLESADTKAREVKVKVPFTHKVKLTTLNATLGEQRYQHITSAVPAEPAPTGVAAAYFAAAGVLHYEGDYAMTEEEVAGTIGPGNKLNISGGPTEWASMDALVQSVTEQLGSGHTTIHFGPPGHLSTQEFVELQRVQRQRAPSYRLQERQDGKVYGQGASVIGAVQVPQATAVPSSVPGKELVVSAKSATVPTDTTDKAILKAYFEDSTGKIRQVIIDTAALVTLAAANENIPDTLTIYLKEWDVCVDGEDKKAVFLSSDPYDPPPEEP